MSIKNLGAELSNFLKKKLLRELDTVKPDDHSRTTTKKDMDSIGEFDPLN